MRTSGSGGASTAIAAALLLCASRATAADVAWTAPPECPTASDVRDAFVRLAGKHDGAARAIASVRSVPGGFELSLSLRSPNGAADLSLISSRCETLADVVALELSIAADPGGTVRRVAPLAPVPARFGAALALGAAVGALPGTAPGVRASALFDLAPVRLELGGKYLLRQSAYYDDVPEGVGAELDLTAAFFRLCSPLPREGFGVATCAGAEVGVIQGSGLRATPTFTSTQLWAAITAAPAIRWAFSSGVSVRAECELGLALARPEFHARNLDTLFRAERAAAALWLGVETAF